MEPRLTAILLTLATLTLAGCADAGEVGPPVPVETPDETVRDWVAALAVGGDEALSVVILRGLIAQEGPPAPAAASIPVRTTSEGSLVEPFLDLGAVEHQPPPGTAIPADVTLEAFVPALRDVRFVVDERGAEVPAIEGADGDQQRASLEPEVPLEPGPHSLTVVLTTPEGEVATSTALYSVEG